MKLHLGCGKRYIPGFIHIDALPYPHVDSVGPIDKLSKIADRSVDLIYACHVLEHFPRGSVQTVLEEWNRVLRKGGTLRLSVPDFAALADIYIKTRDLSLVIGPVCGRQDHEFNFHYNIFDFSTLSRILAKSGFSEARKYDWRTTDHADVDDFSQAYFPHMDKENGVLISLNVEATKN